MNITLFDAAQSVRDALSQVDPETGELTNAYEASRELFEQKGAACVAYAVEEAAAIEAAGKLIAAMSDKLEVRARRLARFKEYLADNMKAAGVEKLSVDGLVTATLYRDRDESVEIDADAVFTADLCNDPKPPAPSKAKIKAAILAGQPIAGARIVRKDRLTIK